MSQNDLNLPHSAASNYGEKKDPHRQRRAEKQFQLMRGVRCENKSICTSFLQVTEMGTALMEDKKQGVLFADHEIRFERWDDVAFIEPNYFGATVAVISSKFKPKKTKNI